MGYDQITGLMGLDEFIERSTSIVQKGGRRFVIITNDLSNFKYVNDFYGISEGDRLINEMAHFFYIDNPCCLAACRTSCDQFRGLIDMGLRNEQEEIDRIVEMNKRFEEIVSAKYPNIYIHVYTGIYFITENDNNVRAASDRAHLAKKQIKGKLNVHYEVYNPKKSKDLLNHMAVVNEFIHALDENRILLYLQPKISVSQNVLAGAEALSRIKGSNGEIITPGIFIPVLESTGMIGKLDEYMIEQVFALQHRWIKEGIIISPISVNVSRLEFSKSDFCDFIFSLEEKYKVPPKYIEFEVTETTMIEAMDYIVNAINTLRAHGYLISVDDFGSGYSSLSQIANIPADIIKIDSKFAGNGLESERGRTVIKHLLEMLHDIHYDVVFEGIETDEQLEYVSSFGCDLIQGYYYSRPIPVAEFEQKYIHPVQQQYPE